MRRPNFFIVGAPKCGTTALSQYLRSHPHVFLSDPKEPHYFAEDLDQHRYVRTLGEYLNLFQYAETSQTVIGEASVGYLFSSVALTRIHDFNPDAKIVAIVRNPIEMALSLHRQLLFARYEDEPDFEKAWRLQAKRQVGQSIPLACRASIFLQYSDACRLGIQIERLMNIFPACQIKVIVFDDFIAATAEIYQELLDFLELPHDGRTTFERINEAKRFRSERLAQWIAKSKPLAVSFAMKVRTATGLNPLPLMKQALVLNEKKVEKTDISTALLDKLAETFRKDIELLSSLLKRDLSGWLAARDH